MKDDNIFRLLLFNATDDCQRISIPIVSEKPVNALLQDGDVFLGIYNENNHKYYGYYVRLDDTGAFHKVREPFILPVGSVTELEDFKSEKEDKSKEDNPDDDEPQLKVTCSAVPWYIASYHWIKSALGFHAAKEYKEEFLNGIEDYQYSQENEE